MNGVASGIPDPILEQASDWLFRTQEAPDDPRLRAALEAWIAGDPRHAQAWTAARRAWAVAGMTTPVLVGTTPAAAAPPPRAAARRRRVAVLALAAGIAALALLPGLSQRLQSDHRTATAETRALALADGSRLTLAADSAVATAFSDGVRGVALLSGAAHFEVEPDRARPFVVSGGDVTVTVTGTAFDVAFTERTAAVEVAEGSVTVAHGGTETRLKAGQGAIVDRSSGEIRRVAVDPLDVGAWRHGRLVVGDRMLSTVVDAIRRHHPGVILLSDHALAEKRVTGVYDLSDPERALRALVGPYGGTVRRLTPYLLVVSSAG